MRGLAVALCLVMTPLGAGAQSGEEMEAFGDRLEQALAAAEADSIRPGDEALSCAELETEFASVFTSPEIQALAVARGSFSHDQMQSYEAVRAQAQREVATTVISSIAMSIASSFIPGLGHLQQGMQMRQQQQMERRYQENMANMMQMLGPMEAAMPNMMRGQRVYELASAQSCTFLESAPQPLPSEE